MKSADVDLFLLVVGVEGNGPLARTTNESERQQ